MTLAIPGLHHITAICGDPQRNVDFYTGRLGQRLVKRTVNFDDPGTYHLYYGDRDGRPGTILTFFPFAGAQPGRPGPGMATTFSYAVASLAEIELDGVEGERGEWMGESQVTLTDPDGMKVSLVEGGDGAFHAVRMVVRDAGPTRAVLELMGYGEYMRDGAAVRMKAAGERAPFVDLVEDADAPAGRSGTGTIHHVAFRAKTPDDQRAWQSKLRDAGLDVTPVIDRQYFDAIYFREPGGILFEIATDPPGFATDEPVETMGERLMLPPQYEAMRARIEAALPPLSVA